MNSKLKQISVFLVAISGLAGACAGTLGGNGWLGESGFRMQTAALDRGEQRNNDRLEQAFGERRRADYPGAESSGSSQPDNAAGSSNDNARRQGKMSPEERRALRRQIDEAGHDIYRPKR
jgi:hypothetical protein